MLVFFRQLLAVRSLFEKLDLDGLSRAYQLGIESCQRHGKLLRQSQVACIVNGQALGARKGHHGPFVQYRMLGEFRAKPGC